MAIAATNATKGRIASGVNNTVTTSSVNTGATGSVFFLFVQFEGGTTFTSVTDNKGNTYTQIGTELTANSGAKSRIYYCQNAAGGTGHTFTATVSTNVAITLHAVEITGAKTASVLNPTPPAANDDLASPFTSNNITTLQADALLVACMGCTNSGSNPATHAEANGFTVQAGSDETDASTYWTGCIATKVVSSTGTYACSFTESGASTAAVWIAAFESASSGGGGSSGPVEGHVPREIKRLPGIYEPEFRRKAWAARNFTRIVQPVNVSVAEAGSAADTQGAIAAFASSLAETGAATDAQSSIAAFVAAATESASAADTQSSLATFGSAVAESGSAADAQSSTGAFGAAASETASASEAQSSAAVFGSAVVETTTATATQVAETGSDATVVESATASSTQSSAAVFASAVAESASATDAVSATQAVVGVLAEAANAVDATTGTPAGSPEVAVAESLGAANAQSATQVMAAAVAESGNAVDAVSAAQTSFAALLETASAIDVSNGQLLGDTQVEVSESAVAVDVCTSEIAVFSGKPHTRIGRSTLTWHNPLRIGR